jgi:hypothetical protein
MAIEPSVDAAPATKYSSDPSERAKQLHQEGRFGGAQFGKMGGRPRKKRASEIVAEAAEKNASKIIKAFEDALDEDNKPEVRINAAKEWLKIEQTEASLQIKESQAYDEMDVDELISVIAERYEKVMGSVPGTAEEITDGDTVT